MKRGMIFILGVCGVGILFMVPRILLGIEIGPATLHDIVNALGPDAKGLHISQEALPDLFVLTASRIEENPKQFIVEQPYVDGRWKGGKAVIEYARDLSYTLVSVYDKDGHRQRIYSVRTSYTEHVARQAGLPAGRQALAQAQPQPENVDAAASAGQWSRASAPTPKGTGSNISFEWDETKGAYVSATAPVETSAEDSGLRTQLEKTEPSPKSLAPSPATVSSSPRHRRRRHHEETTAAVSYPAPAQTSGIWLAVPPKAKTPKTSVAKVKVANTTWVERHRERPPEESPRPKRRRKHSGSKTTPTPEVQTVVSSKVSQKSAPPAEVRASDEWVPKSMQEPAAPTPTRAPKPVPATPAQEAVPSTEELLAPAATKPGLVAAATPDTSEGDKWVPKATPKPAVTEPEVPQEPMQVANIPKPAPVDNSVDNLLKMANEGKSEMPHESDRWVPKKTEAPKPDVDLNKELMRIREQEKQQAAPKSMPKIKHDINNPEEGVLPVSSFEKFSGPLYGRHREYERRFFPGKRTRAGTPNHDFYVEEVDRKKEIHNIYFYKHEKGKAPKLVAVERHEKVSFLGNYDIEKEDKGKISTYN